MKISGAACFRGSFGIQAQAFPPSSHYCRVINRWPWWCLKSIFILSQSRSFCTVSSRSCDTVMSKHLSSIPIAKNKFQGFPTSSKGWIGA